MEDKKISIISIIYKVEPFLEQCLKSLVQQTYQNLEIILVVGIGTDGCQEIAKRYADKDSRIKLIECPAAGASDARNKGLAAVTGDYIGFLDGDDWADEDMFESLMRSLTENNGDISVCGRYYEYQNVTKSDEPGHIRIMNPTEAFETILYGTGFFLHCWDKLFKRELFNGIDFPLDSYVEDRVVVNRLIEKADKIIYNTAPKYHFRIRRDSMSRVENMMRFNMEANERLCSFLLEHHKELKNAVGYFMIYEHMTCIQTLILKGNYSIEKARPHEQYVRKHWLEAMRNRRMDNRVKIKVCICILSRRLFTKITKKNNAGYDSTYVEYEL